MRSDQPRLVGPGDVGGEPLTGLAPLQVGPQHPLAVVGGLVLGDLVSAELAAEARLGAEVTAEVHLEALDALPGGVPDDHALEADVRRLEPGAAVRAAVHVDAD